jgi:hypothetical protein
VATFAIVDLERLSCPLMLLEDRLEAEQIAAQLARKHRVAIRVVIDSEEDAARRRAG